MKKKKGLHLKGKGGVRTPCTLPLDPPLKRGDNRSYARLRHMLKIHHQDSLLRHLLELSLLSWCFHVSILFILTAVGIGSR